MSPDHLLCLQHLQNERIFDKQTLLVVALENEEEDIHHILHRDRNSRGQNNLEGDTRRVLTSVVKRETTQTAS